MANNYSQFDALMKKLIDGTIDKDNFNGTSLEKFAEHQDVFWDGLLQYLQYESDTAKIKHFGIRESDFNKSEIKKGIVEFINENCDLANDFLDSCLAQTDGHWNESYNAVLKYFNEMYGDTEIDETNIKVSDIVNANAGNSFESNVNIKWVMPWENMDKENYAEVRGNDKIVSVLDNSKYLQFTHLFDKYLRLLMPEYQRDVQIEDLDRNFWVIGQVLTGICSYLFNGESPLNELFDGMLDEITQLWENVLYLWTAFAIVSQYDKFMSIQPIVVPINAERKYTYYQRYDNYDRELNPTKENLEYILASIWNSNKFLADNYKNSTVIIIPEIRENSYLENYYAKIIYPGAIVINRRYRMGLEQDENNATNQSINIPFEDIQFYPFLINDEIFSVEIKDDCSAAICGQDVSSILWGYTEKNFRYQFFKPFNGNIGSGADKIIAEIRTVFTDVNLVFSDYQHYTFDFKAEFIDVAKELAGEEEKMLGTIEFTDQNSEIKIVKYKKQVNADFWGDSSQWQIDTNVYPASGIRDSNYAFYNGKRLTMGDYIAGGEMAYNTPIDISICYAAHASDTKMPLADIALIGNKDGSVIATQTEDCGWFLGSQNGSSSGDWQTFVNLEAIKNGTPAQQITTARTFLWSPNGTKTGWWMHDNHHEILKPIVKFNLRSFFGVVKVILITNDHKTQTNITLKALKDNINTYKNTHYIGNVYMTMRCYQGGNSANGFNNFNFDNVNNFGCAIIKPFKINDSNTEILSYYQTVNGYGQLPIANIPYPERLEDNYGNYVYGVAAYTHTSSSDREVSYPVYMYHLVDHIDIVAGAWNSTILCPVIPITTEVVDELYKGAAAYGVFFSDDFYTLQTDTTNTSRYFDNNMMLGVLDDNGVGHGEYTRGMENVNNPAYNWKFSTESSYTPPGSSKAPQPPAGSIKITKGHYRGENVSWQKIVEPTMSITIEKNWINVPYGENFEALIELVGKDKYNIEQVSKRKLFTSNGASTYTFDNLPSYDIYGEVMHYTAREIQPPEGNWNVVGMNTDINYNSANKTATFTNTYQT